MDFKKAAIEIVLGIASGAVLGYGCVYAKGKWDKHFNKHSTNHPASPSRCDPQNRSSSSSLDHDPS